MYELMHFPQGCPDYLTPGGANSENFQNSRTVKFYLGPPLKIFLPTKLSRGATPPTPPLSNTDFTR